MLLSRVECSVRILYRSLTALCKDYFWREIFAIDPDLVIKSLSFDNVLLLVTRIYCIHTDDYAEPEYARRLMYGLKNVYPEKWNSDVYYELFLRMICDFTFRYHEQYYAYKRAMKLVDSLPPDLALDFAGFSLPGCHRVSKSEAERLYRYVLKQSPCVYALDKLIELLNRTADGFEEVASLRELKLQVEGIWPFLPPRLFSQPIPDASFQFDASELLIQIATTRATKEEILECIDSGNLLALVTVDPWTIIEDLPFDRSLQLSWELLQGTREMQEYAVCLLYPLALEHVAPWVRDWRNDALLGYACEKVEKWDEQYAAFDKALFYAPDAPVPANLCIALARCAFNENPWITFEEAIAYVQEALKEEMYVDALELLVRLYTQVGEQEKVIETQNALKALEGQGKQSPSYLPECLTSEKGFKG